MGRKKIKIARITDDRNRSVTYLKRKAGLMKKAHELAVLTGSEVAVIVFGQNGKLTEFCSGDMDRVLLRYTEHTGPVERKGPENYQNDDDDSDDDGGDDDDEGAAGGTSGQGYGESAGNGRGSGAGGSGSGPSSGRRSSGAGRNQKRKAPGLRQDFDAQSTSSSTTSSRRGSSPSLSQMGPLIRVDNANAQDTVSGDGVDKDTLKAAIFQRTLSHHRPSQSEDHTVFAQMAAAAASAGGNNGRPINLQHHHSLSTGDYSFLQQHQFSHAVPGVPGPARPSTAGSIGGHGTSPAAYGTPQRQASPRFAFPSSPSGFHVAPPTLVGPQQGFLSPQPIMMPPGTSPPAMPVQRAQSVTSLSQPAVGVTYGDLARGGGGAGMSGPRMPALQQSQSTDGFGSDNKATIDHGSTANNHLMPLAHPILRQHPQYETYSMQLRSQQAQGGTVPAIHTAPSSPGIAAEQVQMSAGGGGLPSDGNTLHPMSGISHIKRSASFGAVQPSSGQGHLAQTRFDASPFGSQPLSGTSTPMAHMPSGGGGGGAGGLEDYASLSGGQVSKSFQPPPPYALAESHTVPENAARLNIAATPTTTSRSDHVAVGGQTISNDDFNDLMGSILGDMEAGEADERLATLASTSPADVEGKARPRPIPFANPTASVKDEHSQNDSLMRSLDSEHSLSTLVNSDSFDALFAGGAGGGNPRVGAMKPDDKVTSSLATTTMPNAEKEPTVQAFSGNLHVKGGVKIDDVRAGHVDTQNAI